MRESGVGERRRVPEDHRGDLGEGPVRDEGDVPLVQGGHVQPVDRGNQGEELWAAVRRFAAECAREYPDTGDMIFALEEMVLICMLRDGERPDHRFDDAVMQRIADHLHNGGAVDPMSLIADLGEDIGSFADYLRRSRYKVGCTASQIGAFIAVAELAKRQRERERSFRASVSHLAQKTRNSRSSLFSGIAS